jgi:hypothetical protein
MLLSFLSSPCKQITDNPLEHLPDQWKESIVVHIHKKGDETECTNYRGISLLSAYIKFDPTFLSLG